MTDKMRENPVLWSLGKEELVHLINSLVHKHPTIEPTLTGLLAEHEATISSPPLSPLSPLSTRLGPINEDGGLVPEDSGVSDAAKKGKKPRKLSLFSRSRGSSKDASNPTEFNALLFGAPMIVRRLHDRIESNVNNRPRASTQEGRGVAPLVQIELPPHVQTVHIPVSSGRAVVHVHCVGEDLREHKDDMLTPLMWALTLHPQPSVLWCIDAHGIATAAGAQAGDLHADIELLRKLLERETFSSNAVCLVIECGSEFTAAAKYADFKEMWPGYTGGNNRKAALDYIIHQFKDVRPDIMVHITDPNDKKLSKFIKSGLQEVKIRSSLKAAGLG